MEAVNKEKGLDGNVNSGMQAPKQAAGNEMPMENQTPIWKKWWLWAIVGAIVVLGALVFFLL